LAFDAFPENLRFFSPAPAPPELRVLLLDVVCMSMVCSETKGAHAHNASPV